MRMYGYVRVSTKGQATEGYGLDIQKTAILSYCETNGYRLIDTYIDAGVSGVMKDDEDDLSKRPGWTKMLSDLKSDKDGIDGVVVLDTDRLWRNGDSSTYVRRQFRKYGVEIFSIHQEDYKVLNLTTDRKLHQGLSDLLAEWDHDKVVNRLEDGRDKAMDLHKIRPAGRLPCGYKRTHDRKSVEIEPDKAELIQMIFELASEDRTLREISETLRSHGMAVYTDEHNKSKSLDAKSISRILHNDYYIGIVTWGGKKIAGSHPAMIPVELWKSLNKDRTDIDSILCN